MRPVVAGVIQFTADEDCRRNRLQVARLVGQAAALGASVIALPEMWACYGHADAMRAAAEPVDGPSATFVGDLARLHRVWIVGGSFPERIDGDDRVYNTCCVGDPSGAVVATYRKIHLFDVDLADGPRVRESELYAAGDAVTVVETPWGGLGLAICYGLRFPELFRGLAARGAALVAVPSAFTFTTGAEHWEALVRARAIENQCFVLAPNQVGRAPHGIVSFGRSLVVDPWGTVLAACASSGDGVAVATLDLAAQARVRRELPALAHARPDLFGDGVPGDKK